MKTDMTDHGPGVVLIKHDNFSPGSITVPVNSTVTWTNKDWWPHTVTSDANFFESGKLKCRKTFSHKFDATGTYNYHCKIHEHMIAKVIVK
jgi:plastocyanin